MMTDALINPNERIDDLQCNGYRLIQNTACFCFGMDAVLLSSFAMATDKERVLDLCTGNGVVPILMKGKNKGAEFAGLEIQDVSYELAERNVKLNGLEQSMTMYKGDVKEADRICGSSMYNVVTCNPPYMNENHGITNPDSAKAVARHELLCNLDDVVRAASRCLKVKGRFYMVHRPHRLADIFEALRSYKLEPKRMRLVQPYADKGANMVLIEAVKGGRSQLTVEPVLTVYKKDGSYTDELLKEYGMPVK